MLMIQSQCWQYVPEAAVLLIVADHAQAGDSTEDLQGRLGSGCAEICVSQERSCTRQGIVGLKNCKKIVNVPQSPKICYKSIFT